MNLNQTPDDNLVMATKDLVKMERETTTKILHHLLEIERRRLFAKLGYSSLFDFATKFLGYSEAAAHRRVSAMRLMREIPEVEMKIQTGVLSLSNVAKAHVVFRAEGKTINLERKIEILEGLENKSTREAEKLLLEVSPHAIPMERQRQITNDLTEIKILADQKLMAKLQKLKNLLSNKNPTMGNKELIEELADMALKKLDPSMKQNSKTPAPGFENSRYIPVGLRRATYLMHNGACAYQSADGKVCESKNHLEIHHIKAFALGGKTELENLTVYCKTHNVYQAIEDFGWKKMSPYLKC